MICVLSWRRAVWRAFAEARNGKMTVRDDRPMNMLDCGSALERLDLARPNGRDEEDATLREAFEHLGGCTACTAEFGTREQFDRRIGAAVRDVAVPEGLIARLHAR